MSKKLLIVGKVVLEKPRQGYLLCERYRYFIVMAVMMALMLPCVANEAVQLAAKTALESMTGKNLAKLYKARTEADNSNQREVIVQACIAGLYAIGDSKNAKKISQGVNSAEFVESFMRECDLCYGGGSSQEWCYKCNGSGACQNRKCNNGIVISEGFDGRSNARKCSNCGGSGRCVNCKGTGKIVRPCSRCNGSKRVINKTIALASCKDMLNALIACGNEIQCRKTAEGTTRLAQQMVEKEKQAREKAESNARLAEQNAETEKRQREKAEENVRLAQQKVENEKRAREKVEENVRLAQSNAEFEKKLANIASARECFGDGCQITANWLQVAVLKRKSGGFNYKVSGECNGVSNTRLYYRRQGWTQTEDVDWSYDLSYLVLSDEHEWMNWMEALKAVRAKVIEWVDVAAKNGIDKVEREIPIGGIEVLAHSNMITKGNGQRELYLAAIRKFEKPSTPVKFFCEMWVKDNGKGEYNGSITARCGYFEQEILSFSGDKSSINNDILLLIERYNPEALKKAYLEYEKKQDLFK